MKNEDWALLWTLAVLLLIIAISSNSDFLQGVFL